MNGSILTQKKRQLLILVMAVTVITFWLPSQLLAYSFDFQGLVVQDSLANIPLVRDHPNDYFRTFTGSVSTENGFLTFDPKYGSHTYQNPGDLLWGGFKQSGFDYSYVFSSDGKEPGARMGIIWFEGYGIAFHFIDSSLDVGGLANFLDSDTRPAGSGFFGIFYSSDGPFPIIPIIPTSQSQVPLPASLWLLGCGLLVVWRRQKK